MNDRATERFLELQDHLIAATELLREEITHAPDTDTAARAAHHLCDIHSVLWRIEDSGWSF